MPAGDESQGHSDRECSPLLTARTRDNALPEPEPEAPTERFPKDEQDTKGEQQQREEQQEQLPAQPVDAEPNNDEKKKKKKKKKKAKKKTPEQIKQDELDELDALIKDVTGIDVNEAPPFRASRQQKAGLSLEDLKKLLVRQGDHQMWECHFYCPEDVNKADIVSKEWEFTWNGYGWVFPGIILRLKRGRVRKYLIPYNEYEPSWLKSFVPGGPTRSGSNLADDMLFETDSDNSGTSDSEYDSEYDSDDSVDYWGDMFGSEDDDMDQYEIARAPPGISVGKINIGWAFESTFMDKGIYDKASIVTMTIADVFRYYGIRPDKKYREPEYVYDTYTAYTDKVRDWKRTTAKLLKRYEAAGYKKVMFHDVVGYLNARPREVRAGWAWPSCFEQPPSYLPVETVPVAYLFKDTRVNSVYDVSPLSPEDVTEYITAELNSRAFDEAFAKLINAGVTHVRTQLWASESTTIEIFDDDDDDEDIEYID